jgi:hypothetical protein
LAPGFRFYVSPHSALPYVSQNSVIGVCAVVHVSLGYSQSSSRVANPSCRSKTIGQMAVENIYDLKKSPVGINSYLYFPIASLNISLNYAAQPNWLTYVKLQELASRVDLELRNRNLNPRSRVYVQGFIWTSFQVEKGEYGGGE